MTFTYSFAVWPDETRKFDKSMYDLFGVLEPRAMMEFTEADFDRFRTALLHHGLTLREIERVPFHQPETVL